MSLTKHPSCILIVHTRRANDPTTEEESLIKAVTQFDLLAIFTRVVMSLRDREERERGVNFSTFTYNTCVETLAGREL